ncbi:IPT/TIG domain-containing protein [Chloroflexota bacterium]
MKHVKIFRVLAVALLLALLVATLPSTSALAAAGLDTTPTSGEIDENIDLFGFGFSPGETVYIYFSNTRADVDELLDDESTTYTLVKTTIAMDEIGFEGYIETTFTVPDELDDGDDEEKVRGGTYYVYATSSIMRIKARDTFTVESVALITIDPDDGTVGTEIEISGGGYENDEDITVEYDGTEVDIESGDDDTDSDGEFADTTIKVPPSTAGEHTITVTGDDSDIEAETEFTVGPEITVTPESGATGSTITVSGTGFGEEMDVTITFDNVAVATDETDDDGSFEVGFPVPSIAGGGYDVEAEDDDDNSAEANFTIAATTVSISPSTGRTGTTVTVNGNGFIASTPITITFGTARVTTLNSDANGDFSATFTVPSSTTGTYEVKATDNTNTKVANFTISTSGDINPKTSVSSPGHVGTELTISGIGFTTGRTVAITYAGNQAATTTVNSNGSFSATFNAPASSGGEHIITATDQINRIQFSFFMESTPPTPPVPLKPEMNIKAPAQAYFDWEDATDPSDVTYTLQIATENFTGESFSAASIVLEKTGLTQSEYTITKAERLKSVSKEAPYYWHAKAIDGASNEGRWSSTGSFYVGTSLALSQPVIYTLIGVGALLLAIFTFWMGRKTAYY